MILIIAGSVFAIGVGSTYSAEIPLEMYPGQEQKVIFSLENQDIDRTISLEGTLLEGSEITSLDKGPYDVKKGESVNVEIKVKVPTSANIGDSYSVLYEFVQVSESEGDGGTSFVQGIRRGFNVDVVEKPVAEEEPAVVGGISWIWWAVIIVAVVLILWWFMKKRE